ncbi:MAG: hypothetical protein H0U35_13725 [Sporichthyaceae bacterium]|nr:hypothetical protein [Sporichthyaceae bacterium]
MRDLVPVYERQTPALPELVALGPDAPTLDALFMFMRDAELRFDSLRMRLVERTWGTKGEQLEVIELWLRHPGHAKVATRLGDDPMSRDFRIWVGDGEVERSFDARSNIATERPVRRRVVGATADDLPAFARVYVPRTMLPVESITDSFVHPHGLVRRVLQSGETRLLGTALLGPGREAWVLRCDHPRISHLLTDRPDHWIQLGVDRMTGLVLLHVEHSGGRVTHHTEVTSLELDSPIPEEAFTLHVSGDVRRLY